MNGNTGGPERDRSIEASTEFRQYKGVKNPGTDRAVRAYPYSPGVVNLQVRGMRGHTPTIASAFLTREKVEALRDHLSLLLYEMGTK